MSATITKDRNASPSIEGTAHSVDFYSWAIEQAAALRAGRIAVLDVDNLAEEIEDLGRETFKELESALRVILIHMLKWDHQPGRRSRSWANSIGAHRLSVRNVLRDNPGLKSRQADALDRAFGQARFGASTEMKRDVSTLPSDCPYTFDEILNRTFAWLPQ